MIAPTRLPLTVIGGYLGSGKTTLVNHLLRHAEGRRLSVLVNDFGEISIDADLITASDGDNVTLANGCVCCSIGGDLYRALTRVLDRQPRADAIVIEASGVAEPSRIAEIARAEPDLRLSGIVVLVDGRTWPARRADPLVGALVARQVSAASLVILNKADLIEQAGLAAIEESLAALAPEATIARAVHAAISPDHVMNAAPGKVRAPDHDDQRHENEFSRWSFSGDFAISRTALDAFLAHLPKGVHRLKGFVTLREDSSLLLVQVEGGQVKLGPAPPGVAARPTCRLVAIGPRGAFDPCELDVLKSFVLR